MSRWRANRRAGVEAGAKRVDLPTLLREADVVVVVCALTEETRHLIGAQELAMMRPWTVPSPT